MSSSRRCLIATSMLVLLLFFAALAAAGTVIVSAFNVHHHQSLNNNSMRKLIKSKSQLSAISTSSLISRRGGRLAAGGGGAPPASGSSIVRTASDQNWEQIHGNYVLRPSHHEQQPRAILHFLGGAFVGAAPHVSYRYMLERLSREGYLIVATPYNMSFDHLDMCKTVSDRFQAVLPVLQNEYKTTDLSTVGIGHSCGSLLHLLMSTNLYSSSSSETTAAPTSANVFMSFNNKPAKDSIPYFDELVAPLSQAFTSNYYSKNPNQMNFIRLAHEARAASDVGFLLTEMEKAERHAGRDVDFLMYEMKRAAALFAPGGSDRKKKLLPLSSPDKLPPSVFSDAARFGISALLRPARRSLQTMTLMNQVVDAMDQFPSLMQQISDGADDFFPSPGSVHDFARRSYRTPNTLILQYEDDGLDESEEIEKLLQDSHPHRQVHRRILQGGHSAPLIAPPLHVATSAERSFGKVKARERLLYAHADATVTELTKWLDNEAGLAAGTNSGTAAAAALNPSSPRKLPPPQLAT